jgi:predicted TIM-barrel enzyme
MAGTPTPIDDLTRVKQAVPATPVFANTGVRHETVVQVLQVADGCVVGTCFKEDGKPENRVSVHNVRRFMNIVREIKEADGTQ